MPILLTADLHIHPRKEFDTRSPVSARLMDGIEVLRTLYRTARKEGCQYVIIAGDLFHARHVLSVRHYNLVYNALAEEVKRGPVTYLLAGNHDQSTYGATSLRPLSHLPNVHVIEKPQRVTDIDVVLDFVPYQLEPDAFLEDIAHLNQTPPPPGRPHYLICHQALYGARVVGGEFKPPHTVTLADLEGTPYRHVYSGHFHIHQTCSQSGSPDWTYIGSPFMHDRSDRACRKSVLLWVPETNDFKHIYNDYSPCFRLYPTPLSHPFEEVTSNGFEWRDFVMGHFVDVPVVYDPSIPRNVQSEAIRKLAMDAGARGCKPTPYTNLSTHSTSPTAPKAPDITSKRYAFISKLPETISHALTEDQRRELWEAGSTLWEEAKTQCDY